MDTDVLVIGGGIAGISAAARLAPDARVVLVEAEPALAYHASGRSAAMYEPSYGLAPVVGLTLASGDFFRADPRFLKPRGLMFLGRADQQARFMADIAKFDAKLCPVDEARAVVPILNPKTVAFAARSHEAWDLDTDYLIQGFVRILRTHGGEIALKAPVTAITRTAAGWRVTAGGREITATTLLNAAGAWADRVAALAGIAPIGLQPYRRSIARIPAPGGHDVTEWPMLFGTGESWYAKPDAGALLVSPEEEHAMEPHDAFADDMVLAEGLARYEEMVTEPVTRLIANWAGLRTFAPDRVLVLGRDPRDPAFVWSAGQGGYGFQTSPAASRLVADLVLGQTPALPPDLVASLVAGAIRMSPKRPDLRLPDSGAEVLPDGRRLPKSSQRNAAPILEVLRDAAPNTGRLLEIAAGSGLHSALFAAALPGLDWQPTDLDPANFASIAAWAATSAGNIRPPLALDATRPGWSAGLGRFQAVLVVNLLHLIATAGAQVLLAELPGVLAPGGLALIYGPFLRDGQATSPGDAAFDASLRAQDPAIGYKDLAWVTGRLLNGGLAIDLREMPANNLAILARHS